MGIPFVELQTIDSTNNYALAQIHANLAQPGTCYFAHEQTRGKGQRGKSWVAEKRANVILSIVLKPSFLEPARQFYLSACGAVAVFHFLKDHIDDGFLKIKWPNDLYWNDQKLGGILIENILGSGNAGRAGKKNEKLVPAWKWSVVGVGINVNQTKFPKEIKNPVSLKLLTGKDYDTVGLARHLCGSFGLFYDELRKEKYSSILKKYNHVLYKRNETVRFKKNNRVFKATVKRVNEMGQLVIKHAIEERLEFGEAEWLI